MKSNCAVDLGTEATVLHKLTVLDSAQPTSFEHQNGIKEPL